MLASSHKQDFRIKGTPKAFIPPMQMKYLLLFLAFCAFGCERMRYRYDSYTAEEFVSDSYKIREGKLSILEMQGEDLGALNPSDLEEYKDTLQDGDVLRILVFHPVRDDLTRAMSEISNTIGFRLEQGCIQLPDLGSVELEGLTLDEAREKIQARYQEEIRDTEVYLDYKIRLYRKVELAGMVLRNDIPVDGKLRLYETLATAKIAPDANLYMSYLIRDGKALPVDFYRLLAKGDMSQNVVMRPGDKIFIADPAAAYVMVMGEVGRPQAVPVQSGSISLRDALVKAGGILFTGDKNLIQVIRGNILKPKVYTLNWQLTMQLPNNSLLLMPGDIVYITPKPITEWNRFIDQLLPSFGTVSFIQTARSLSQ